MLPCLLKLQSKALPLQPSSPLPSAVPGRPSPPHLPPSFALQLRPLQLWDTSASPMQSLILKMKRQGLPLQLLKRQGWQPPLPPQLQLPKLLPSLLWGGCQAALCCSVWVTGTRCSSSLRCSGPSLQANATACCTRGVGTAEATPRSITAATIRCERLEGIFGSFADASAQGPTLVIVRSTNGFTFGGYAAAAWKTSGGNISAAGSFVFWVENPQGRAPGCLDCTDPESALFGASAHGPVFNGGSGNGCLNLCGAATSYARPSGGYADTTGLGDALFTGSAAFTPEDYEVWAVT